MNTFADYWGSKQPNNRSALNAGATLCFHIKDHWPGASDSGRWAEYE